MEELFGKASVTATLCRLNEIHHYTEEKWKCYLAKLRRPVRYLLIAEAPPWKPPGERIEYVLDSESKPRRLMQALRGAFSLRKSNYPNADAALAEFAHQGLLIVDSIPFSMDYSKKRGSPKYHNLVQLTVQSYLLKKLSHEQLFYCKDLRIAFGFKCNGEAIIKGLGNKLKLKDMELDLKPEQIAANSAGFPDAGRLREIFDLPKSLSCQTHSPCG